MYVVHRNGVIIHCQVVMLSTWDHAHPQIDTQQTPTHFEQDFCILKFWKCEVLTTKNEDYFPQCWGIFHSINKNRTHNLCVVRQLTLPLWYYCVILLYGTCEISLFVEATDYRSNLAKTILFENCSCFSKIPFSISVESPRIFQGLISIPAGHWVRQIDGKSSAIYLADSFCQHYSALWSAWQEDPNDPQERCAMARTSCARL